MSDTWLEEVILDAGLRERFAVELLRYGSYRKGEDLERRGIEKKRKEKKEKERFIVMTRVFPRYFTDSCANYALSTLKNFHCANRGILQCISRPNIPLSPQISPHEAHTQAVEA